MQTTRLCSSIFVPFLDARRHNGSQCAGTDTRIKSTNPSYTCNWLYLTRHRLWCRLLLHHGQSISSNSIWLQQRCKCSFWLSGMWTFRLYGFGSDEIGRIGPWRVRNHPCFLVHWLCSYALEFPTQNTLAYTPAPNCGRCHLLRCHPSSLVLGRVEFLLFHLQLYSMGVSGLGSVGICI